MNDNLKKLMNEKEEIIQKLEEIQKSISKEDIKNATVVELAEFTKMTLDIQRKLAVIEKVEKSLS